MPRPPKSAHDHWLNGTTSAATAADHSPLPAGRARYPRGFSAREKAIFKDLARQLEERQHATAGDAALLELAARVWARWQAALDHLRDEGEIVEVTTYGKDGQPLQRLKPNPWLAVAQQSEREIIKVLVQLGMTPATRDRVKRTGAAPKQITTTDGRVDIEALFEQQGGTYAGNAN